MKGGYKHTAGAIMFTMVAFVINFAISMFLVPFITSVAGIEAYGFVTLAKNIAEYCNIALMAINSFCVRFVGVHYHRKEEKEANTYFSSAFFGNTALGIFIFMAAGVFIVFIDKMLNIPAEIVFDVKLMFLFTFIKFTVNAILAVYECGPIIANRLDITGVFKILSNALQAILLIILFKALTPNIYYVGIALAASAILLSLGNVWITRKFTPELKIKKQLFKKTAIKDLLQNGVLSSLNSTGNFLHSGLDMVIADISLSPYALGVLAVIQTIDIIFKSLATIVAQPFQSILLKCYADKDKPGLLKQLYFSMKVSGLFASICFAGFTALGLAFYKLWIPEQDIEYIFRLTVITITTSVSTLIIYPSYFIYNLTLKKIIPCLITLIGGAVNVISMLILINFTNMGIYAIILTTVVIMTFSNFVLHPIYIAKVLKIKRTSLYPTIGKCVLSCITTAALFKGLTFIYTPSSWITLIASALVLAIIGVFVHSLIVFTKEEKRIIKRKVTGRLASFKR